MGSMFRSEQMALCQIFIQPEAAYPSVSELGEAGTVQFRDLNSNVNTFQRKFVQEVRRCDELERKLRYIETELKKDEIKMIEDLDRLPRAPNPREIIDLEAHLEKTENEILELAQNEVNLKSNFLELTELKSVLENTQGFFSDQEVMNLDSMKNNMVLDDGQLGQARGKLEFVAGVIRRERVFGFERMLWRISRGNVFLRRVELPEPLKDPATGHPIYKTVFVAFFQGEQLKSRIRKVCSGFHASLYPCPSAHNEREEMVKGVRTRLEDLKMVLNQTEDHRRRVLVTVSKELPNWNVMVMKMKAIYHTLNLFNNDVTQKCLIGECWVPVKDLPIVQKALADGSAEVGSTIPSFLNVINTNEQPPTFNRTNKFTKGFQNLIDAYGVATYREVNPALYTIVTFPFLFGVMFGDLGHGIILLLFAGSMVMMEKRTNEKKMGEISRIFYGGRYIILLMGCFAIYSGLIYNDLFSKSMNIFGSQWFMNYDNETVMNNKALILNPTTNTYDGTYPLGLDPVWQLAENKIIFSNSLKMKLSIIFGVVHMLFGVIMSVVNDIHFRTPVNIILVFIPQVLFLLLMFGYMAVMMFMKWIMYSAKTDELALTPGCAPSILIMFINMVLFKSEQPLDGCKEFMYEGQDSVQMVFVFLALLCIPWLLLGKPIYILLTRKSGPHGGQAASHGGGHGHGENEPASEIFILQAIHTIEYILSTISHTASYLRLWALSLAHAELSEIAWGQLFGIGLVMGGSMGYIGSIMIFLLFGAWAGITVAIMVMMEGLSAFLHTLRLHWVEFMSKFYEGQGYAFMPFSFKQILEGDEESQ